MIHEERRQDRSRKDGEPEREAAPDRRELG